MTHYKGSDTLFSVLSMIFGIYLLAGATSAALQGKWPIFLPPQLDVLGLLLSILGSPLGAYIGALFLSLLGGAFLWLGAALLLRKRHA